LGRYQLRAPSSFIVAGSGTARMSVASIRSGGEADADLLGDLIGSEREGAEDRDHHEREPPAAGHAEDPCPGCGDPLDAVTELSELVGLRALPTGRDPVRRPRTDDAAPRVTGTGLMPPPGATARCSPRRRPVALRRESAGRGGFSPLGRVD
jgi:hypothetical protein